MKRILPLSVMALLAALCLPAFGLELKSDVTEKARAELQKAVADGQVVAAAHLVVKDGKPLYHEVVGMNDADDKTPFKADSIVRIYSMSKALTSVAAMTLFDQGKFQLDDPVSKYIPAFEKTTVLEKDGDSWKTVPAKRQITVRDLFRHTSGYSYGGEPQYKGRFAKEGLTYGPPMGMYPPRITLEKAAEAWARIPAVAHPGTRFIYGLNTDLLGRLIEIWSGKPLDIYMQEAICKPLEMVDSGFSVPAEKRSRFASCHTVKNGKAIVVDKGSTSQFGEGFGFLSGGGGMVSTMSDYSNFCQMLVDGGTFKGQQILKPATLQEMFTNQMKEAAGPMQFGLGFAINDVKLGTGSEQVMEKQFSWAGYATTDFRLVPSQKMFQIFLRQHLPSAYEFNRKQMDLIQTGIVIDKPPAPATGKAVGIWQLEYEFEGNQIIDDYQIAASKTGELTGKLVRAGATVATLEKIKLEGEQFDRQAISFSAKGNRDGTDWTAQFVGTITGDEIDGMVKISFNGQTYDLPWKPKRVKPLDGK